MNLKKLLPFAFIAYGAFSTCVMAQEETVEDIVEKTKETTSSTATTPRKLTFYGQISNDFFFNTRQNQESSDGMYMIHTKPIHLNAEGRDINATPQAEMLSINTRLGFNVTGGRFFNADVDGKVESDYCGSGNMFFLIRLRQAYVNFVWPKSELLIGQAFHSFTGSVTTSTISGNSGGPFLPFNRSPMIRYRLKLGDRTGEKKDYGLTLTTFAAYEMQFASTGAAGNSGNYLKNSLTPDFFIGAEWKTKKWINGIGFDMKRIKPNITQEVYVSSFSPQIYSQYANEKFTLKGKATLGENLTSHIMLGGIGVSKFDKDGTTPLAYTNYNNAVAWVNALFTIKKVQTGILLGIIKNLGTNAELARGKDKRFLSYGYGFYNASELNDKLTSTSSSYNSQITIDRVLKCAPQIIYTLPNEGFKCGLEYDFLATRYGNLNSDGTVSKPYSIINHRIMATVQYSF